MDDRVARIIRSIKTFEELAQFEKNAEERSGASEELRQAIEARATELGRTLVSQHTGLDLSNLSPAEEKIVRAVSEYVGLMKRQGKTATRTFLQLRNRGLIGSAETAVAKAQPAQGFRVLNEADRADLSYEQIIVDHPEEFSPRALWYARRTLGLPNQSNRAPAKTIPPVKVDLSETLHNEVRSSRNPPWSRDELILALDLYLRFRRTPPGKDSEEIMELSALLGQMGYASGSPDARTFRNANGVYMKMMNFRRFDSEYTADGKVGLTRGNRNEEAIWKEFSSDPVALSKAVAAIRARVEANSDTRSNAGDSYWVFVCNPKRWNIDRFLEAGIDHDTWGVRPADRDRFAPGQLGIVRVGVDQRTAAERKGKPGLEPGIYALCEVESEVFAGAGANSEFWGPDGAREPGWPTVNIRYLRNYLGKPLTIERLRMEAPDLSRLLLNGFQAASFAISPQDFHAVMALLGEDLDELPSRRPVDATPEKIAALERKYLNASPEVKTRISKSIERGPVGALVKKALGFKCQVCNALGRNPIGFRKKNGEPYVEAHHVMPVSRQEVGSLAASNIMILCANHHRQMHYGDLDVMIKAANFEFAIDGQLVTIPRSKIADAVH